MLDFFLVNEKMRQFLKKMLIDEEGEFSLSNIEQIKKNGRIIETDHNPLIVDFDIEISSRKPVREEIFNLKNKDCQELFRQETEENQKLISCFENNLPFSVQGSNWNKLFNSILYKCFKKVRVVNNKKKAQSETNQLLHERIKLKKQTRSEKIDEDMKIKIEERIKQIKDKIGDKVTEDYHMEIVNTIKDLGGDEHSLNGIGRKKMWNLLKKKYPKTVSVVPVGKKDAGGNIITNHEGLKHLYQNSNVCLIN